MPRWLWVVVITVFGRCKNAQLLKLKSAHFVYFLYTEYFEGKNVKIRKFPFAMTPCYIVKE